MVPSFNKYNRVERARRAPRVLPSVIGGPGGCLGFDAMLIERR